MASCLLFLSKQKRLEITFLPSSFGGNGKLSVSLSFNLCSGVDCNEGKFSRFSNTAELSMSFDILLWVQRWIIKRRILIAKKKSASFESIVTVTRLYSFALMFRRLQNQRSDTTVTALYFCQELDSIFYRIDLE